MNTMPLGTSIKKMPFYTDEVMTSLIKNLKPEIYKKILAGNNHGIAVEAMLKEKKYYEASESLESYLKERHKRKVEELQEYCDKDKVWYEQKITQEIVDYVKKNQEILSGVLNNGKIYITKFPYNPEKFLNAKDELEKRYQYCHCSFARESIKNNNLNINRDWCYCSAGFAKFPFEVILDRELNVELLETVLDDYSEGEKKCRFAINIGG